MKNLIAPYACGTCSGTGLVIAVKGEAAGQAPWAFKCSCERGRYNRRNYPEWTPEFAKTFKPVKIGDFVQEAQ